VKTLIRVNLAAAVSLATLTMQASAQETGAREIEQITVTGYLRQSRESLFAKQNEARIADYLAQDELGRQPDLNVADSLRRLPGVVTVFDEDEGRYVGLRGLDQRYTFIGIDGGQIASTDRSDRDINIESIPPTAVKRIEVIKAVTPDMDGHSVGGVINLVTRSAFDSDGVYSVTNAQVGWHESIGDLPQSFENPSYRIDTAYSSLFLDDTVGVLVSGTYFTKRRDQGRPITDFAQNDIGAFVSRVLPLDYANKIDRYNALLKVEFKPNDDFYTSLTYSAFDYQYSEVRYRYDLFEENLMDQTATTGTFESAAGRTRFDRFPLGQEIRNVQGNMEFTPTDLIQVDVAATFSHGRQEHPYPNASWKTPTIPELGYSYNLAPMDLDDNDPAQILINDPSVLFDPALYSFRNYFNGNFENEETVAEFRADLGWNADGQQDGFGYKAGFKHRNLDKSRFDASINYTLADPDATLSLAQFIDPNQIRPPTAEYFTNFNYPILNPDLFDSFFASNQGLFVGNDASNLNAFYDIQEAVTSAYAMLTYNSGPHTFMGGLRFEHTNVSTAATLNRSEAKVFREFDYDHFLPSFVYTNDLRNDLKLRVGFAQALGRPNHPDLAGAETFDEANLTIRRANTGLQPRESDSFDVALDWSIDQGQYFSAAAFYKDIGNQISSVQTEEVIDGQTFLVTQPLNLDSVSVSGLELSYTDDVFEFLDGPLSGLGFMANLTLMDGQDGPGPGGSLLSQPDYLFNVAALYNLDRFSGKLTYNEVDDRPTSSTRAEYKYQQWDLQLRYQVTEQLQLQFEGRNIFNAPRQNIFVGDGPINGAMREINDFGNSWWIGASYRY